MSNWLNVNNEDLEKELQKNEDRKFKSYDVAPGVYNAKLAEVYLDKTDSGATMVYANVILQTGNDELTMRYSNCLISGDSKGNKSTYTNKNGKEITLPGVVDFVGMLTAIGTTIDDITPVEGAVEAFGDVIKVKVFKELFGKQLMVGVINRENEWDGNVTMRPEVKFWMDKKGNYKGEYIADKAKESIEKNPVIKLKAKKEKATSDDKKAAQKW
jgi:hypothetical protein